MWFLKEVLSSRLSGIWTTGEILLESSEITNKEIFFKKGSGLLSVAIKQTEIILGAKNTNPFSIMSLKMELVYVYVFSIFPCIVPVRDTVTL